LLWARISNFGIDQAGKNFHVLVLRTTPDDPYTSGFIQLNCEYWSNAAEAQRWVDGGDRLPVSATQGL
jgi:hypothetical protein